MYLAGKARSALVRVGTGGRGSREGALSAAALGSTPRYSAYSARFAAECSARCAGGTGGKGVRIIGSIPTTWCAALLPDVREGDTLREMDKVTEVVGVTLGVSVPHLPPPAPPAPLELETVLD